MKQLLNDNRQNRELAALMIKKQKQGGKLDKDDQQAFDDALARTNARALANRQRRRSKPIDWESGKDARAESRISRATRGVKKVKKKDADKAAKAHGEKINDSQIYRLTTTGELVVEQGGLGLLAKLGKGALNVGKHILKKRKMATAKTAAGATAAYGGKKVYDKASVALSNLKQQGQEGLEKVQNWANTQAGQAQQTLQKASETVPNWLKKQGEKVKQGATRMVKNPDGTYTKGAKIATGVGGAYAAKKAVDAARGKDKK